MKKRTQKSKILDQIMRDLKKSSLPLLKIDGEISRYQDKIAKWEARGKADLTKEQKAAWEESGYFLHDYLEYLVREKEEVVRTTMYLIKLAIKGAVERVEYRLLCWKSMSRTVDHFSFETKRQPFHKEAIEKFGSGIKFSYPLEDGSLQEIFIPKLETWHHNDIRSGKRHNKVRVYFQVVE